MYYYPIFSHTQNLLFFHLLNDIILNMLYLYIRCVYVYVYCVYIYLCVPL